LAFIDVRWALLELSRGLLWERSADLDSNVTAKKKISINTWGEVIESGGDIPVTWGENT